MVFPDEVMSERLTYSLDEAAKQLSLSKRTLQQRIADGAIRAKRDGGRTIILHSDLLAYINRLPHGSAVFKGNRGLGW